MVAATLLTLIFVPVFYALIERAREGREAAKTIAPPHTDARLAPHAKAAE
jgi:hypothetical protein